MGLNFGRTACLGDVPPNGPRGTFLWSAVLVVCLAAIAYLIARPSPSPRPLPGPPPPPVAAPHAPFFDNHVQPAIAEADQANREAAERCIQRLHDAFEQHRHGISPFIDDLTSWSTRFGIVRRMPADWWYEQRAVQEFVQAKIELHLFSDEQLRHDIESVLAVFREDVKANEVALLTNVKAAVSASDLPDLPAVDYGDFSKGVASVLQELAVDSSLASVSQLVLTEISSGVGGAAAAQVAAAMSIRIAAMAASSSASAGGATAGGTAMGGSGGTLAGPVGTAVGAAVGLVIGVAIDLWLTNRFKAELDGKLNAMIDEMEATIVRGSGDQLGLQDGLAETCDALRDAYRECFHRQLVTEPIL